MNWRLYFPLCVVCLAFLGIGMEQSVAPNQEIIVQFINVSNNPESAKQTIANLTNRLENIGVSRIQVSEIKNGSIKVTYFSSIDFAEVQKMLDAKQNNQFGEIAFQNNKLPKIPFQKDQDTYILKVLKIEKDSNLNVGFQGLAVQLKLSKDQYLNPFVSVTTTDFIFTRILGNQITSFITDETLLFDVSSYKIPEVRAGPFT